VKALARLAMVSAVVAAMGAAPGASAADPKLRISDLPADGDTSIVIKKGADAGTQDFEVVSGNEDVVGEPKPSNREAYASWKAACAEWKKEMRELNKENSVIALNCNASTKEKDENGLTTHKSSGTYKMRVRLKAPR
jgi:hypothetical protein